MKAFYDGTWTKAVKHELIDRDMRVSDLAAEIGRTRAHVSQVVNGKLYSLPTIADICDALGIQDPAQMETQTQRQTEDVTDRMMDAFNEMIG